jgi:hypothetical protein
MARIGSRGPHWLAAIGIAAAALAIGAVFGVPGEGHAAAEAAPVNSATPTISGTPQENSTLTAANGTWSGSPTGYTYAWSRCNQNGDTCSTIAGAAAQTYALVTADVGSTIRVAVTATNADGSAQATSAPTAVVSSAAAPTVTTPPAVTGTTALGSTLTASTGTWTGSPTGYTYAWSRCDATGAGCAAIGGATAQTYVLAQPDVGTTLRVTVKATNSAGSTSTTTVPTAVVTAPAPPPATGCPAGTGGVNVTDVTSPARLAIGQQTVTPGLITLSTTTAQLHVRVTACGGRPVQGVLVFGTAIPYNQYSAPPEGTTGADGTVNLTMTQRSGFPASRHQQLLVVFIRARKPGEPVTGGISTRLLVSFPVSLKK